MKNKAIIILAVLCCAASLTACSSGAEENQEPIPDVSAPAESSEDIPMYYEDLISAGAYESKTASSEETEQSVQSELVSSVPSVPQSYDDIEPVPMNTEEWHWDGLWNLEGKEYYLGGVLDSTVTLTEYLGDDEKVILPNTYIHDGREAKVKALDLYTFYRSKNNKKITEIFVSEGIEEILDDCFFGCDNLESIHLPSTIRTIGLYSLSECPNLKKIYYYKNTPADPESPNCAWEIDGIYNGGKGKVEFIPLGEVPAEADE